MLPTAVAAVPFVEQWDGSAEVRAFLAGGTTVCRGGGDATLLVEREMEAATFVVAVAAECVPTLVLRGVLAADGWRFRDDTGTVSGGFFPTQEAGVWRLVALVDTCPPMTICEFPRGVELHGVFADPTIIF